MILVTTRQTKCEHFSALAAPRIRNVYESKEMKRGLLLSIALIMSVAVSAQDVEGFVNRQMQAYPKSRLLDIYKSCFQDYMGAEHLVSDGRSSESRQVRLDGRVVTDEGEANTEKRPSVESWSKRWHKIIGTIDQMKLDLPNYQEDKQFIDSVLSVGKYAISHSPDYREAYHPHYRIVERSNFEKEIKKLIDQKK